MENEMFSYKYPHPSVTADCVIFGFDGKDLNILLIERGVEPYKGEWALPGGFLNINETVEECAKRELMEETNIKDIYIEQFHTFSGVYRDPRERVITVAFLALVSKSEYNIICGDDAADANWFKWNNLPPLAFDHADIIKMAKEKLREKIKLSPVIFNLLDKKFKMSELQRLYELINGKVYDRRNFNRKMISTGLLIDESDAEYNNLPSPSKAYENVWEDDMACNAFEELPKERLGKKRGVMYSFNTQEYLNNKEYFQDKNPFEI